MRKTRKDTALQATYRISIPDWTEVIIVTVGPKEENKDFCFSFSTVHLSCQSQLEILIQHNVDKYIPVE